MKHSVSEYVRDQALINGMESFWSMMERGHDGIYHKMSPKPLQKYVDEFAGRHNMRNADTIQQMECLVLGMVGKRYCGQRPPVCITNGLITKNPQNPRPMHISASKRIPEGGREMPKHLPEALLIEGDCLRVMPLLPAKSVDLVLCDLPYGTTQNRWDSVLPLELLWENYARLLAPKRRCDSDGTWGFYRRTDPQPSGLVQIQNRLG